MNTPDHHWVIQQRKPVTRGSLETGAPPVFHWVTLDHFGSHPTRLGAMRRYVEELDPGFRGCPDLLIRRQWRNWARSNMLRTTHPSSTCP